MSRFHLKSLLFVAAILLTIALPSCRTSKPAQRESLIFSDRFDEQKNQTILSIVPYGNFILPGNWSKTSYNEVSHQHFFHQSEEKTNVAIAKTRPNGYPFYKSGMSDSSYLHTFYQWEADYLRTQNLTVEMVDDRTAEGYLIWRVFNEAGDYNTLFLFGIKNGFSYNLSSDSATRTEPERQVFIVDLFRRS